MFEEHRTAILEHAQQVAPEECLGVVYDGRYIPLKNVAPDPEKNFLMSSEDMEEYCLDGKLEAVVHSHVGQVIEQEDGTELVLQYDGPSKADMTQQQEMGLPWVIAHFNPHTGVWSMFDFGDHCLDLPILERPFRHGVEDCYSLIRKWWWQNRGVKLDEFPRDDYWWVSPDGEQPAEDMYMEGFQSQGFERIFPNSPADLEEGDVFLQMLLTNERYNHGGVYVGNGLIAHHPPGTARLSHETPVGPVFRRVNVWLRRPS